MHEYCFMRELNQSCIRGLKLFLTEIVNAAYFAELFHYFTKLRVSRLKIMKINLEI